MKSPLIEIVVIGVFYSLIHLTKQNSTTTTPIYDEDEIDVYHVPDRNCTRRILIYENEDEIITNLYKMLERIANISIKEDYYCKIGLTGRSLVNLLVKVLPKIETEWPEWRFFFCEERLVSYNDSESVYGTYRSEFAKVLNLKDDQFIVPDTTLEPKEVYQDYFFRLLRYFPPAETPRIDILLFDVDSDGHTISLPTHRASMLTPYWLTLETNPPKTPPDRITFTFPVINNAKYVFFIAIGKSKAKVVKTILEEKPNWGSLPASMVNLSHGEIIWILDKNAASQLTLT